MLLKYFEILGSFWSRPALGPSGNQRVVDAAGDVDAFIGEMRQRYSTNGNEIPQFYQGAYAAALREAQRELVSSADSLSQSIMFDIVGILACLYPR